MSRRSDRRHERERRKRLRWAEEKKRNPEHAKILFAKETTFGVQPNVEIAVPGTPRTPEEVAKFRQIFETVQAGAIPPSAVQTKVQVASTQLTGQLNENFEKVEAFAAATTERMNIQENTIGLLLKLVEEQQERIQALEAAALGAPLEEMT